MRKKYPKAKHTPLTEKIPKKAGFDENPYHLNPAWRVGIMEFCDPYGWQLVNEMMLLEIQAKLRSFESMTWAQIIGPNSHPVAVGSLCKQAQERLIELHLDDIDELFSLRLSGRERIWGILEHNILTLLWWDPNHDVCPSLKRNT